LYKVLLVDDEADVREGLLQEVDWEACGFTIAGTAENGQEAKELAERVMPDVVITDISMPFMDGLQLSEWIRTHIPLAKIVILTGYDEFDYARQAVRLSVDEYLLKPFSADAFRELLGKIRARIGAEVAEREDMLRLREHYRTSLPVLGETFLASLLTRKLSRAVIDEKVRSYGLGLEGSRYAVAVLALHSQERAEDEAGRASLRASGDRDLMLQAMLNIAKEIWDAAELGAVLIHQDNIALIAIDRINESAVSKTEGDGTAGHVAMSKPGEVRRADLAHGWQERVQETLGNVLRSIEYYLKLDATVGFGSVTDGLAGLKDSFGDALLALDYRLVLGPGKVIPIGDVERRSGEKLRFDELKEGALVRSLKLGTPDELADAVVAVFADLADSQHSFGDMQVYLLELATAVLRTAKDADAPLEELFGPGFQLHAELFKFAGVPELQAWFHDICLKLMRHIASKRQVGYKDIVEKAIVLTKEHYADSDWSIQRLCSELHVSAGYFSGVFKKEVKLTYGQYMMSTRMEAAMELLRTTELKAFEIAEKVGFADPNYFSFCFKKSAGISPKEYRGRLARPEEGDRP
jgi:two-component system response regulator YesN